MAYVMRTYECAFGHRFKDLVQRGDPPPDVCPTCDAIVGAIEPIHAPADARSDTVAAPGIRGARTKAVARFEDHAFKRAHYEDGSPLMTNLRDNVRPGESYAIPETPSTNITAQVMHEMHQQRETEGARQMLPMGGGWQGASPEILQAAGGPQNPTGRPVVDLKSRRA